MHHFVVWNMLGVWVKSVVVYIKTDVIVGVVGMWESLRLVLQVATGLFHVVLKSWTFPHINSPGDAPICLRGDFTPSAFGALLAWFADPPHGSWGRSFLQYKHDALSGLKVRL